MARNLITDVAGVRVGHADDAKLGSGATVVLFDQPAVAAADLRGGGPGTRESALLDPAMTVERIDAIALAGGSAFGLDAASGAQAWLREQGRGFEVRSARVPIVPAAILFDLLKRRRQELGPLSALSRARLCGDRRRRDRLRARQRRRGPRRHHGGPEGRRRLGVGADAATARPSARWRWSMPRARAVIGGGPHFWAAPYERDGEFGGHGQPASVPPQALAFKTKGQPGENTTLVVVATDAALTKAQARRLAIMAQDGMARALRPVHTPLDGDIVFVGATGVRPLADPIVQPVRARRARGRRGGPRHRPRRLRGAGLAVPRRIAELARQVRAS